MEAFTGYLKIPKEEAAAMVKQTANVFLSSEEIEIFENWLEGTVEIISGVPVVCVDGLIQMKKKLGREKHLMNIALMKKR